MAWTLSEMEPLLEHTEMCTGTKPAPPVPADPCPSQASRPEAAHARPVRSADKAATALPGARVSTTASAAVPIKAAIAATCHPIWPYLLIAVPSGDDGAVPRADSR